jgi:predicted MFS family arabinose efflux permease
VFFIAGFGMAAWAPLVPYAKLRLGIGDGALGLLLLSVGIGSLVAMPMAGVLVSRFGCRSVIVGSATLLCGALPFLATVAQVPFLAFFLFGFGAGLGAIDVAMNMHAICVERAAGRAVMSGFHGLFSLGGIAGAAGVSAMLGMGASPLFAEISVLAVSAIGLAAAAPHLLRETARTEGPVLAVPRGTVLFIGVLCFVGFLTEGAVLDWSALFLTSVREIEPYYAGLGFAAFSATMTLGRIVGDRIVRRLGGKTMIGLGGLCAAGGFAMATLLPSLPTALLGYAFVGAGCSNIVPVLFSSAGRQPEMPESAAVPAITALGYAGILAGPALIGFVAQAVSLSTAFLVLTALLLGVAASGRLLRV